MIISKKGNFVYFANPKTATTTIEHALRNHASMVIQEEPELKHIGARRFQRFIEPLLNNLGFERLDRFGVMRDPVEWLFSWYRYRGRGDLDGYPNSTAEITFDQFIENYLSGSRAPYAKVGSPNQVLCDGEGNTLVENIYAYEAIEKLGAELSRRIGKDLDFTALKNTSPIALMNISPANMRALEEFFARDYEIYYDAIR